MLHLKNQSKKHYLDGPADKASTAPNGKKIVIANGKATLQKQAWIFFGRDDSRVNDSQYYCDNPIKNLCKYL